MRASVAQWIRAVGYEPKDRGFKSHRRCYSSRRPKDRALASEARNGRSSRPESVRGRGVWFPRWPHKPEHVGSNPTPVTAANLDGRGLVSYASMTQFDSERSDLLGGVRVVEHRVGDAEVVGANPITQTSGL